LAAVSLIRTSLARRATSPAGRISIIGRRANASGGTEKIAAINIAGYCYLIDPAIDAHHERIVKRTSDGSFIEFSWDRSA
jgi:hypothetical protein